MVISVVLLVSFYLLFMMLNHLQLLWRTQEASAKEAGSARYVLTKVNNLLYMAGYKPSVKGIHSISGDRLTLEFLAEDADALAGVYSRHRLYTVFHDGDSLKLLTQRRRLPLDTLPAWEEGATTILADGVASFSFSYYDGRGRETTAPPEVRLVSYTLAFKEGAGVPFAGQTYRSAVYLRNHRG